MKDGAAIWPRAFIVGVVLAGLFALVLRVFPDEMYTETSKRILMFALAALAAPPTVFAVRWLAQSMGADQSRFLYVANTGAITFDSIATGFAPQVYGHQGPASHVVLSVIVFGLVSIFLVDQFTPITHRKEHQ